MASYGRVKTVYRRFRPRELRLGSSRRRDRFPGIIPFGAQQGEGILGVKRVPAHRLLPGGVEGNIQTAIIGQNNHGQVAFNSLPLRSSELRILFHLEFHLFGIQVLLLSEGSRLDVASRNPVLDQETLGTRDAPLGQVLIETNRATLIGVPFENQVGTRLEGEIAVKIARER